ncbi:nucleotide exchange factor GrpE [Actinomadura parmotrematis]|uniref:Nucleotide exchange factor GrpE n=1 Tax=Actinomadura parmotrematis TaxID=2864039 RepID=A0ABS7FYE2_9ACTN|nr:nucleotide exchange factor GrpE [Actinomadura parmotrematis]MBW8485458.1 nucleotide exchange factor GrpE [Actinomadura parmotrematis]
MSSDRDRPVSDEAPAEEAAPVTGDGAPDPLDEVRAALAGLADRVARDHERAAHREAIIDRLHEENQRLRRGELAAMLEPVRAMLLRVHDRARQAAPHSADDDGAALLNALADDVVDALARIGVTRFDVEPGAPYDAARHRPVATEPVPPDRAGSVVAVRADGFEQGGRVVRKAEVCVGKAAPEDADPGGDGDASGHTAPERLRGGGPGENMKTGTRYR